MIDPWEYAQSDEFLTLQIDGESLKYNAKTGEIIYLTSYRSGEPHARALVYRTGRGVVKVVVDGASHRMMDIIAAHFNGGYIKGYQGYPKNGDFSDLRWENIIMVRTREALTS